MRKFTSLLLLGFALGSFAQTPGGVSGSELWFKTAPLNSDLQGYYRWQDFSGDSIRLMLLDSRGVKSELTLPNSSVHYFNFNPSLWLADGFRSLSAKLKHGDLSQATVIGVFAPELATIGKDMVVYALDGRKGDGAILSKDKAVRVEVLNHWTMVQHRVKTCFINQVILCPRTVLRKALCALCPTSRQAILQQHCGETTPTPHYSSEHLPPLAASVRISRPRSSVMLPSGDMPLSLLFSAGCLHPMSAEKWRAIWR